MGQARFSFSPHLLSIFLFLPGNYFLPFSQRDVSLCSQTQGKLISMWLDTTPGERGYIQELELFDFTFYLINYFIFGCTGPLQLHVGFLQLQRAGAPFQLCYMGFSLLWLLFLVEHRLQVSGSVVMAPGLSCPEACWIFLDQGSNLHLMHWQVDS